MYLKPKKENKKRTRVIIIVAAAIVLGLIIVFIVFQIINNQKPDNKSNNSSSTSTSQTNQESSTTTKEDPKKVTQYEGNDPNDSNELTGSITSAFIANGQFILRVNINQYISGGTCTLTMTKGTSTFTRTVPLIANVSSSTCQGFDAQASEVSTGTWHAVIDLNSNDGKKGKIESEVNL